MLSVARGKVSEGIDFDHNYGRAVIMFGYVNVSPVLEDTDVENRTGFPTNTLRVES